MNLAQELKAVVEALEAAHVAIGDLYEAHVDDEYIGNKVIQDAIERGEARLVEAENAIKWARMQLPH